VTITLVGWPSSIYMFRQVRGAPLSDWDQVIIVGGFASTVALSVATWLIAMRFGVNGLEALRRR
jgi:hypothetical protein